MRVGRRVELRRTRSFPPANLYSEHFASLFLCFIDLDDFMILAIPSLFIAYNLSIVVSFIFIS